MSIPHYCLHLGAPHNTGSLVSYTALLTALGCRELDVQRAEAAKIEQESRVQASADSIRERRKLTWILAVYHSSTARCSEEVIAPHAQGPLTLLFHRLCA
jgi:hypothetical protein